MAGLSRLARFTQLLVRLWDSGPNGHAHNHDNRAEAICCCCCGVSPFLRLVPMKAAAFIFFFLVGRLSVASTRPTDGTSGDVQRKINDAGDGDIVSLPAGTKTWTTGVTIPKTKAITLQGTGIGSTIIQDGVQSGPLLTINVRTGDNT